MVIAVSTAGAILAWIGLAVGLVVFALVVYLLSQVFKPIREIDRDVATANSAGLIEHGVKGVDGLSRTRQLASQVPDLALAYLAKLGAAPGAGAPAAGGNPFSRQGPGPAPRPGPAPASRSGWQIEDS